MPVHRLALALILAGYTLPSAAAADYSVRGVVSVNAGAGACSDSELVNATPAPSLTTAAGCVAPSGSAASGETVADLATGSVGLLLLASPLPSSSAASSAQTQLTDQLHFTVPGGIGQNENLLVDVTWTLDGQITSTTLPTFAHPLDYSLEFYDFADPFTGAHGHNVFASRDAPYLGPESFTKTVALSGAFLTANVAMLLGGGIQDGSVDFLHGATIAIAAPPGVTFTSDSGVFLSAPEPAGSLLGCVGLLAITALRTLRA